MPAPDPGSTAPELSGITSGQYLLSQARVPARYLRDQPDGWLSGHHLIKSIRYDTLHQQPPLSADNTTRIEPPKPDQRALLMARVAEQTGKNELASHLLRLDDALPARSRKGVCADPP